MRALGIMGCAVLALVQGCSGESETPSRDCARAGVLTDTLRSPGENVTGLAWGGGTLWAVDAATETVFRLDPVSGDVLHSFPTGIPSSYDSHGLAYSTEHNMVILGAWDGGRNGYVYRFTPSGEFLGSQSMCGG